MEVELCRSKAETHFSASKRKDEQVLEEREKIRRERAEKTAKLRALRLSKDEADKGTAKKDEAENAVEKDKTISSRLPQAHRRFT